MKQNRGKLYIVLAGLGIYAVLLVVLIAVESASPDASITSVSSALWYTLTTLTTVGYGDLYPVTAAGRIIGAVFQLFSLGLLALIIGLTAGYLRDALLPKAVLLMKQGKPWYVFAEQTAEADVLAGKLAEEQKEAAVVFASAENSTAGISTSMTPAEIVKLARDPSQVTVFCLSDNEAENNRTAYNLRDSGCAVCCRSEYEPEHLPEKEIRFSPYELCARLYWHRFPVLKHDEKILLIGEGRYADAILEQGLMLNVTDPQQQITYTVCGDYSAFRRLHPSLNQICHINGKADTGDSLIFCEGPWNSTPEAVEQADRIILCSDSEDDNLAVLSMLKRYYAVSGVIHARMSMPADGAKTFGSVDELWTPELVLHRDLSRNAVRLNDIYRQESGGNAPCWNELSSFTRRSNLASADHLMYKVRILLGCDETELNPEICRTAYERFVNSTDAEKKKYREIEHERWMRFHLLNGWHYAQKRDNSRKLHPLIRPFAELSEADQAKDDYSWLLLKDFGKKSQA